MDALQRALAEGRVPGREVMDGALVIFGGALLLTPGFLSDILGLILLLPPTRAIVRSVLVRRFGPRVAAGAASGAQARMGRLFTFETGGPGGSAARRPPGFDDDVVEGTASDVPPPRRELP